MGLFYFLLLIGPLIFFHELGHFAVARYYGVRVDEFAIGFGPQIARFKRGDTTYSIRALPLGGFVLIHGAIEQEEPEDELSTEESAGDSFTDKPIWQRILILLAGPAMNILLPIPILFAIFAGVQDRTPAVVGMVMTDSPAAEAGLLPGDEVVAVNGKAVGFFDDLSDKIASSPDVELTLSVLRGSERLEIAITPEPVVRREGPAGIRTRIRGQIGVLGAHPKPIINVPTQSDAYAAGLRTFDTIMSVNGQAIWSWPEAARALREAAPGSTLELLRLEPVDGLPGDVAAWRPVSLTLDQPLGADGAELHSALRTVAAVAPCSPADNAGLQAGDRILSVNGRSVDTIVDAWTRLYHEPDATHELGVERDGELLTLSLTPMRREVVAELRFQREETFIGFHGLPMSTSLPPKQMTMSQRLGFAFSETFFTLIGLMTSLIGSIAGMFIGAVDTNQLGGPIAIFQVASDAGSQGWGSFFEMMAFISVNLAVINMVPVPGLDGGQISLLTIEAITRRPLSPRTKQIVHFVGVVCIILLMVLVFKNDLQRYWGDIRLWFNG